MLGRKGDWKRGSVGLVGIAQENRNIDAHIEEFNRLLARCPPDTVLPGSLLCVTFANSVNPRPKDAVAFLSAARLSLDYQWTDLDALQELTRTAVQVAVVPAVSVLRTNKVSFVEGGRAEAGCSVSDGGWDRQRTANWDKANKAQAEEMCRRCKEADCPKAGIDSSEGRKREWEQRPVAKG
jgi:hypothetical protein